MNTLYLFRFSHYCEKVCWADDYLGTGSKRVYWLPGLHAKKAAAISGQSQVPILSVGDEIVAGSADVIAKLQQQSQTALYPSDESLLSSATTIAEEFDELGPIVRGLLFNDLLNAPSAAAQLWISDSFSQKMFYPPFMRMAAPMLRKRITANIPDLAAGRVEILRALDKLMDRKGKETYLVGGQFSIADLTVASILMPTCMPEETHYSLPLEVQRVLTPWFESWDHEAIEWVRNIYARHRRS